MVTAMGRETLQRTVDIAQNKVGLDVIYGDTDSVSTVLFHWTKGRCRDDGYHSHLFFFRSVSVLHIDYDQYTHQR